MMLTWIISSSVLLAGFLVLRHILTAAMSRRLQYALWAIVLLRLLLPFSFGETGFSVMNVPPVQMLTEGIDSSFDGITSLASSQQETGPSLSPQPISSPDQITPTRVLFYFWLAGTLGIGAYFAAVNLHFALRLRRSRQAVKCKQARLPVYKTDAIGSPCLFGLFPSAIYVTSEALEDPTVFRHVIAHETTHFLHGDAFWSLLRGICVALHWYNPLVWWAAVLSHRDSETACDEATLQRLGQEERAAYGRTLIRMACQKSVNPFILSAPLADNRQFLRERIARVVQKGKNKITRGTVLALLLFVLMAAGCTFTGGRTASISSKGDIVIEHAFSDQVPDAVVSWSEDFLAEKIHALNQSWSEHKDNRLITEAKITGLTPIPTGVASLNDGVEIYRLEYRLCVEGNLDSLLVGGMSSERIHGKNWLTEWGSTGQPYLLFYRKTTGTETIYQWVNTTDTDSLMFDYSKPELLSRYGNCYTAAAMSCYNQLHSKSSDFVP